MKQRLWNGLLKKEWHVPTIDLISLWSHSVLLLFVLFSAALWLIAATFIQTPERVDISVSMGAIPKQTGIRGVSQGRDGGEATKGVQEIKTEGSWVEERTTAKEIKRRRSRQLIQHHGQRRGWNRLYPPREKPKAVPNIRWSLSLVPSLAVFILVYIT